jgi:GDPmannose 4,6-dehydratase
MNNTEQRRAFITGLSGQDGSYLAEYLLSLNYEVHGIIRRHSLTEEQDTRIGHIRDRLHIYYGDMTDPSCFYDLLAKIQPHEIYNLAAQSHVRISFENPHFTTLTNANGVLNLLEAYRTVCPSAHFYQASSSEMFGNQIDEDGFQREETPMHPVSPYGCTKLYAYSLVRNYRHSYDLHASNGILFNHESPRRGSNFVTNKVAKTAVEIKLGLKDKLELGNLDSYRDWGHAKDYVRAMHMMVNHKSADDFVVSTMNTHSVRELVEYVFSHLDLDYKDYVVQNPKYMRPEELDYLKGDSSKARKILGWEPKYTFKDLMNEMIDHWINELSN